MKSEVMGPTEKAALALVEKLRSPAIAGATITLEPDAAKAVAESIEFLAQTMDAREAQHAYDKRWRSVTFWAVAFCSFMALANKMLN